MFEDQAIAQREANSPLIGGQIQSPGLAERLQQKRESLDNQLKLIDEALAALESEPGVAKAVEAISRLGHLGY